MGVRCTFVTHRPDTLDFDFACYDGNEEERAKKVWKAIHEFQHYITVNQKYIPNYGERYRYGETISTAFVETRTFRGQNQPELR